MVKVSDKIYTRKRAAAPREFFARRACKIKQMEKKLQSQKKLAKLSLKSFSFQKNDFCPQAPIQKSFF